MRESCAGAKEASETRQVERVYGSLARVYDTVFDWALRPGREAAVHALDLGRGRRILEVGVGTGLSLEAYPDGVEVTGIDISEPMLRQARERASRAHGKAISIRRMDAQAMSFEAGSFDHVIAPYVISVVPNPEQVMREIVRVCRPGGSVVVVNHFVHGDRLLQHFERWATPLTRGIGFRLDTQADVVTRATGLEVQDVESVNLFGWWKLVVLRRTAAEAAETVRRRRSAREAGDVEPTCVAGASTGRRLR